VRYHHAGGRMAKKKTENKDVVKELEEKAEKTSEIDKAEALEESKLDQQVDLETAGKETQTEEAIPSEIDAINTDNETAKKTTQKTAKKATVLKAKTAKPAKPKVRSKKYSASAKNLESGKKYPLGEAIKLAKQTSYSKFDGTLALSLKLEKSKKADDSVRGTIKLPHGSGKQVKIEIASDAVIEKIKTGWVDFDILVATPADMPKLAQVAKILGPKGKMPNPKDSTVVDDPKAALEDLGGKVVRYRADIGRNIHIPVGKVSWDDTRISENIETILKAFAHLKKESVVLSATMGAGVKLDVSR